MTAAARPRGRLFRKYLVLFASLVSGALLASGAIELYFSYREIADGLEALQREKALGAAARIEAFVKEIERHVGWASQAPVGIPATVEQRRLDYLRLLRQAPAVTEVSQLDAGGREQLRVSRLAMDVLGSQADFSRDPRFTAVRPDRPHYGLVYFRKESEPYLSLSMDGGGRAGVTVAEVNLKFIWDVVSQIRIGRGGLAWGRWDYGAIGSVTNLAGRLCGEARPGQVLAARRVMAAVEGLVEAVPVGELALKGFSRPVAAFELIRLRAPA